MTFSEALPETSDEIRRYIGMEVMAAKAEAEKAGWTVVRLLEIGMPRTLEYQPNRLNLTTDGTTDGLRSSSGTGTVVESDNG